MQNNEIYKEEITHGLASYKVTIESILGGLYGRLFKNSMNIYREEIPRSVYFDLMKKHGENFPVEYLTKSLKSKIDYFSKKDPEYVADILKENIKSKEDNKKYSLKELYGPEWLKINSDVKEQAFELLKKQQDGFSILNEDSISRALIVKELDK